MGLFNFYNKQRLNGNTMELPEIKTEDNNIEIPRSVFIEERDPDEMPQAEKASTKSNDLEAIYAFLQEDYESKGYNDAMTNPDDSYKADNIMLFKQDLNILIQKVTTRNEDLIRDIDFHIASRERAGLIDLVEQLKSMRLTEEEHMRKVEEIRHNAENDRGMCKGMILSYQPGFMRGLATVIQS